MKSNTVNEKMIFESNPLTEALHKYRRKKICLRFPILKDSDYDSYLSLWKYLANIPERFYLKKASKDMFAFLENLKGNEPNTLIKILKDFDKLLFLAFKSLDEINQLEFHDTESPSDGCDLIQFCDNHIHPNYLKLIEGVYANLIIPFSAYQRIIRNKSLEGFDVFNRVEELKSTQYKYLSDFYNNTIRNSIAHGGITYRLLEIIYKDENNLVRLSYGEVINYFNDMLDTCNGLSLGFCLFYFTNFNFLGKHDINIPQPIMIEELQAETDAPEWKIKCCLESEIVVGKRSQLNIYTKNRLFDPSILRYYAFRSAILAERFTPGYERYFIKLDSKYLKFGLVQFNGLKLKMLRTQNDDNLENYVGALENRLIMINPKFKLPRLFYRIITLLSSFKIIVSLKLEESKVTPKLVVDPRYTEIHRNGHHSVVKGKVVVKTNSNEPIEDLIRTNCGYIVKETVKSARKRVKITDVSKYLPLGCLLMHVYSEDFRIRKLKNSGLIPELLCTIEFKRLKRIRTVDIAGGKPEIIKGFRIVWNKNAKI